MSSSDDDKPGQVILAGKIYMPDAKGNLVPLGLVKPVDMLMDEVVRKMMGFAVPLSEQVARFWTHCFEDVESFRALIAQEYGASVGGKKGNISLTSFDGTMQVRIQVADLIEFGPELQAAKSLVDQCLTAWSEGSSDELRAVVNRAFQVDKEGKIDRSALFSLLRVAIEDERWLRAMQAIRDSIRIVGTKSYVRFYRRADADGEWEPVTINLAAAA